jgi:ketosteroid isomerase-like protein
MSNDLQDFERFMQQREDVARAYVSGDAAPLGRIITHAAPATFFGPSGGYRDGADDVAATYKRDAALFAPGGDSHFEILQMAASDGIAYWVGFQWATVHMQGGAEAIPMKLRVTEVFRREGNAWKLVHRHADSLASEPGKQQK